jgi:hypothetical protein
VQGSSFLWGGGFRRQSNFLKIGSESYYYYYYYFSERARRRDTRPSSQHAPAFLTLPVFTAQDK